MRITAHLFEAFLKCPTKCWLRATNEAPAGHTYAEWVRIQNESYRVAETKRLLARKPPTDSELSPPADNLKVAKWHIAVDIAVTAPDLPLGGRLQAPHSAVVPPATLNSQPSDQSRVTSAARDEADATATAFTAETRLHATERVPAEGRGKAVQFIPIRFLFANKLGKDDRLLLAYDAFALSAALGRGVAVGKIVHGEDHATLKVKIKALAGEVRKSLWKIAALLSSPTPPDLVLNRHCSECEFQARCRQKALEQDDLSLLGGMSAKERQRLRSNGISTVTQLSYTFRPRRRPKWLRDRKEKYHHSLKALAIREKKIHIVGTLELKLEGTPVYLDVEGLPDRDFYYLIGVRIGNGESAVQHSLWADTVKDEGKIWREFLDILQAVKKPVLIHYGSYETVFLKRMRERYRQRCLSSAATTTIEAAVNLLSVVFAQVYLPCPSNSLKEVAGHMGFRWSDPTATGIQTVAWRQEWETTRATAAKQALLIYNTEDCEALDVLTHALVELGQRAPPGGDSRLGEIVDTAKLKREYPHGFGRNKFAFPELHTINDAAYWDYQRERVYVKSDKGLNHAVRQSGKPQRVLHPNETVECARPRCCPKCGAATVIKHAKLSKTVFDLKFMRYGLKRWITCYQFQNYRCQNCGATFTSQEKTWGRGKFGPNVIALAIYLNIELRLPQGHVDQCLNRLFGFDLAAGQTTNGIKEQAARTYRGAYEAILKKLCSGRLLHVDETKASVRGNSGFVWIFASIQEVAYVYSETREGNLLQTMLKDFKGVLVSDFYAAYDSIRCPQQKCLIHLIRDLNDDVLKHPYDAELKDLALALTALLKPIVETIDRYGLKCRFLKKHLASVKRFYRRISETDLQSETAAKFKERLEKNREKLFTFLNYDGVPWNNNNAEHAVKPFAALRHVIGGITTEKGIRDYLVLLSLCETCKYMGLDFLDFLRSGEKDIYAFAESRRARSRRSSTGNPEASPADESSEK